MDWTILDWWIGTAMRMAALSRLAATSTLLDILLATGQPAGSDSWNAQMIAAFPFGRKSVDILNTSWNFQEIVSESCDRREYELPLDCV